MILLIGGIIRGLVTVVAALIIGRRGEAKSRNEAAGISSGPLCCRPAKLALQSTQLIGYASLSCILYWLIWKTMINRRLGKYARLPRHHPQAV